MVDPELVSGPAFDFRRVRTEPDAHLNAERVCDVGFADDGQPIERRDRALYPPDAVARRTVRCDAATSDTWLEVIFTNADDVDQVSAGRRVALAVERAEGGRHGYVLARFEESIGEASTRDVSAGEPARALAAFDFERLRREAALARSPQECAVDFVSEIHLVEEERRSRLGYPEGVGSRLDVKCLHENGDSWIDLVFMNDDRSRALDVAPGRSITVEILSTTGGFAERPITAVVSS